LKNKSQIKFYNAILDEDMTLNINDIFAIISLINGAFYLKSLVLNYFSQPEDN